MIKFRFLSILLFVFSFVFFSCTKEGPAGPQGPTGATGSTGSTGPQGTQGPAGTANVIYSAWFTLDTWADTTIYLGGRPNIVSRSNVSAPGISQTILNQGVVLSYLEDGGIFQLPVFFPDYNYPTQTIQFNFILYPGLITYYLANMSTSNSNGISLSAKCRYIIIPGAVAGGRGTISDKSDKVVEVNGNTYTESQLKTMSYQDVCTLLNIQG